MEQEYTSRPVTELNIGGLRSQVRHRLNKRHLLLTPAERRFLAEMDGVLRSLSSLNWARLDRLKDILWRTKTKHRR